MTPQEFAAMGLAAQKKTSPTGTASPTLLSNTPINPSPVPTLAQITSNPSFVNYDPNGGMQAFNDTWGNDYTYRDPSGAKKPFRASSWDTVVASANKNGGNVDHLTSILKPFADKQYANDQMIWNRRDNNAIFKELTSNPVYSGLANKGLTQAQVAETIAAKLAAYGITDLNQLGVANGGKFYSKLTGKEIPKDFGYTTWGNGLNNFSLQVTPDGRVVPTTTWEKTGMSTGGILGALTAVGAGLAAPWAIPAIGSGLGVGAAAAGGLYGAGTGALSSAAGGGSLLGGALTGGLAGAVGGGLLGDVTGAGAGASEAAAGSLGSTGNVMGDILGGSITSGAGASGLISAAPIGSTIGGVAGGMLNPALAGGLAGIGSAAGGLTLADALAAAPGSGTTTAGAIGAGGTPSFDLPFQSPSSISPIGESTSLNNTGTGLSSIGSTAPDLGTGMITSPEGLSGLVNSPPIGTTLGAATPGTIGGYLVPSLGGEALATTAAAGGLASSASSVTDWLGNVFNQGVDKFMSDPLKNTLNLVSGISSYLGNQNTAKTLEDLLKGGLSQSDPFGSQRAYYMDRLKNTYTNPEGYLKSPEYSAISKRRLEALERADAAQGRRSQYGARTEKMHEFDLENLNKERAMLAQLAGSGINPSQVSSLLGSLGTGSAQAQANAPGNLLFMLNEIFGGKK